MPVPGNCLLFTFAIIPVCFCVCVCFFQASKNEFLVRTPRDSKCDSLELESSNISTKHRNDVKNYNYWQGNRR